MSPAPAIIALIISSTMVGAAHAADPAAGQHQDDTTRGAAQAPVFMPPPERDLPDDNFGKMVRLGKAIFTDTKRHAGRYVGNGLSCANCHLDEGRHEYSAPLWGAYVKYPAYRKKTGRVDTYEDRLQGCFRYSMNGKAPPSGSKELTALVTYSYWLASGAPVGKTLKGAGYPELPKPASTPDIGRGAKVYAENCVICHGPHGKGTKVDGKYAFPPLWGADSFNWGAGMHRINTAAAFIKANMPLGKPNSLSDADAWDVAAFVVSHERPPDPRYAGSLAATKKKYHDEMCYYGDKLGTHTVGEGLRRKASR